jgi:hypothetical protein
VTTVVSRFVEQQAAGVRRHLERARDLKQVQTDLDPAATAPVLLDR